MNRQKLAAISILYSGILNADGKKKLVVRGGSLALIAVALTAKIGSIMNPQIRTDHPKLRLDELSILPKIMGKTTPPKEDPAIARPIAAPRRLLKYCGNADMAGNISKPSPMPVRTPWASMNCQYSLQMLVIITANRYSTAAGRMT